MPPQAPVISNMPSRSAKPRARASFNIHASAACGPPSASDAGAEHTSSPSAGEADVDIAVGVAQRPLHADDVAIRGDVAGDQVGTVAIGVVRERHARHFNDRPGGLWSTVVIHHNADLALQADAGLAGEGNPRRAAAVFVQAADQRMRQAERALTGGRRHAGLQTAHRAAGHRGDHLLLHGVGVRQAKVRRHLRQRSPGADGGRDRGHNVLGSRALGHGQLPKSHVSPAW